MKLEINNINKKINSINKKINNINKNLLEKLELFKKDYGFRLTVSQGIITYMN